MGQSFKLICPRSDYCRDKDCYHRDFHKHTRACNKIKIDCLLKAEQCVMKKTRIKYHK